jgi:hypothetical protein
MISIGFIFFIDDGKGAFAMGSSVFARPGQMAIRRINLCAIRVPPGFGYRKPIDEISLVFLGG